MSSLEYKKALAAFEEELEYLYAMEKEPQDAFSIFENIDDSIDEENNENTHKIDQNRNKAQSSFTADFYLDVNRKDDHIFIPNSDKNNEHIKEVSCSDRRRERSISEYNSENPFHLFIQSVKQLRTS